MKYNKINQIKKKLKVDNQKLFWKLPIWMFIKNKNKGSILNFNSIEKLKLTDVLVRFKDTDSSYYMFRR